MKGGEEGGGGGGRGARPANIYIYTYIYIYAYPPKTYREELRLAMGRTCKDFRKLFYMVKCNHT